MEKARRSRSARAAPQVGPPQARKPFLFSSRLNLLELTGRRARTVEELLEGLREVPEAVIYHHTHHYLQQHQYLSPEPPNDFAYWVTQILGDTVLGEKLAAIDICQFTSLEGLRQALIRGIEEHLAQGRGLGRAAPPGQEFQFVKAITFVLPTGRAATALEEFLQALQEVTINSLYYHIFEARLRLGKPSNDFSEWLEDSLGEAELARAIARLDPYTHTMEGLRQHIAELVERRLGALRGSN